MHLVELKVPAILIDETEYRILSEHGDYVFGRKIQEKTPSQRPHIEYLSDQGDYVVIWNKYNPVLVAQDADKDLEKVAQSLGYCKY